MMQRTERIEVYRLALLRWLATLFAAAGMDPNGGWVSRLPRPAQLQILRVLQPIESAARRLVMTQAQEMAMPAHRPRSGPVCKIARKEKNDERVSVFQLFDRRKSSPELAHLRAQRAGVPEHKMPRILDLSMPWIPPAPPPSRSPRDLENAASLCRRMLAVHKALSDPKAQARRLLRRMAKRNASEETWGKHGPRRPGDPPGYRPEKTHDVDNLLWEVDRMAREAPMPYDTS